MDHSAIDEVALLSIHPKYVQSILSGEKRVEFRKSVFKSHVSHIAIYSTRPVSRVVGWFRIKNIHQGSPEQLWRRFQSVGGIDRISYRAYYAGTERAVAIEVGEVVELDRPVPLRSLSMKRPPQSFTYLRGSARQRLFAL